MFSATFSCEEDDELNIIRGLDFNIAELNAEGNEIGVIATTIPPDGRIVYTVDFGDPNSEEDVFQTSGHSLHAAHRRSRHQERFYDQLRESRPDRDAALP